MAERKFDSFYIPPDVKFSETTTYSDVANSDMGCALCTEGGASCIDIDRCY